MNTRRLTTLAMLIAIYSVLSVITPIKLVNFKFTFEAFPVLVAGLLFGPVDGLIVGGVGSFIYQVIYSGYGINATTLIWILPHAISGLIVGAYAKKKDFTLTRKQIIFISIVSSFVVTALNCVALLVDSLIYDYYSFAIVFGNVFIKLTSGVILSLIYSTILPDLISFVKKRV